MKLPPAEGLIDIEQAHAARKEFGFHDGVSCQGVFADVKIREDAHRSYLQAPDSCPAWSGRLRPTPCRGQDLDLPELRLCLPKPPIAGAPVTHPGLILRDEFFVPMGITQVAAAEATGIPQSRLSAILSGRRAITADTAARLGRSFGVDPRNWLNLQVAYDLREYERGHGRELTRVKRVA